MTILSTQLSKLQQKETSALEVDRRQRVSILFDPQEAMKMTHDVVLEIAKTGVETIAEIDEKILNFSEVLFGDATLKNERTMLQPSENEELTNQIRECLVTLSPHMLLRPAQKCLEWLLFRFYIAEVQPQDLIFMLLPYHDTNLFTKMTSQIRLPNNWRWLTQFKREPPHRNIVIKNLRSDPTILSQFMTFSNLASEDKSSPLALFSISMTNIIISQNPKDNILSVIMSNALKGLQGTQNQRSYALSAIASICNQNITTDRKMDKSLAKKLLKYVLSEESILEIESLLVAGLIYYSTESEFDLPQKFTHRAIRLINAKPSLIETLCSKETQTERVMIPLVTKLVEISTHNGLSSVESMETDDSSGVPDYDTFVSNILSTNMSTLNLKKTFDTALKDLKAPVSQTVLAYVQQKDSTTLTDKLRSSYESIELSSLPPAVLIFHDDEKIRVNALTAMGSSCQQETLKTILRTDNSKLMCRKALELLKENPEEKMENLNLISTMYKKFQIGKKSLLKILPDSEGYQKSKIIAYLINFGEEGATLKALKIQSIMDFENIKEVFDILAIENLKPGLTYLASNLLVDNETKNGQVIDLFLESPLNKTELCELIGYTLSFPIPENQMDKIVKLSFGHPKLSLAFIKYKLGNSRAKSIDFFARFGLNHISHISGATAILRILFNNSTDENRTAQICALRGMTSSDILTRENSLEVFKLSSPTDDNVVAKLQKKSAEILSDKDQLKQVLNKVLRKKISNDESWSLLAAFDSMSDDELVSILIVLKPDFAGLAEAVLTSKSIIKRLVGLSSDSNLELIGLLFNLLPHVTKPTTIQKLKIEEFLKSVSEDTSSVLVDLLCGVEGLDIKFETLVMSILQCAQVFSKSSLPVSKAVQKFVQNCGSDTLCNILMPKVEEDSGSVVKAKRRKMSKLPTTEVNLDFYVFLLSNIGSRSVSGLEKALNSILTKSLKTEGENEDRIQSLVIGLCAKTDILKPENLVEVVRRCSVGVTSEEQNPDMSRDYNLTLISALGLLSHLATNMPAQVLSSLMSVFTFMGHGLLPRADDRFSFNAIQQTIKCVVPKLLSETPDSIYKIVDTFSNATPHVPVHRRETVFQSLMVTCGVTESLHIGWLTLAVKHVVAQRGDNIQDPTDYFDLMTSLIGRFSVREIIDSSVKMASYVTEIKFKMTPDDLKKDKILDTNMTQDDIINFHYFINFFMYRLYSSHDFIHGQLARITEEEELNLNEAYGTLLNKLLQYTERLHNLPEKDNKKFRAINGKTTGCIERVLQLLPPIEFTQCITNLITNSVETNAEWQLVQSLEMLCSRLKRTDDDVSSEEEYELVLMTMILEVLHNVMKTVTLTSALNLALKAVKLISKNTINLAESEKASKILVKMLARMKTMLDNDEIQTEVKAKDSVFGSLLLTGAVIISEVKLKALPHLTWVINQIIDGIGQTQSDQMRLILMVSLCKILESMSQFISPYLESIIKVLCLFDPKQQTDLGFRVTKTIEIVSKTSSRLFLPAVSNIYGQMDNNRITPLLYIVERHIDAVDKTTAVKQQANLQQFFIEALEFRTKNKEATDRTIIQNIEQATCQALVRLALKLPEASLRPLIYKIFTWATLAGSPTSRLFSLYSLYTSLSVALKSMFPLFIGSLGQHLIELIPKINDKKEPLFDDSADQRELLCGILKVLKSILTYDHGEFLDEQASNDLIPLIINLSEMTNIPEYGDFCDAYLIPAIAQSAATISDDTIWRPLNYRILLKMRHEEPNVRICALKTIEAVVEKLGDDYQNLLHESAPFLAELLEDDDENVERKIHETVKYLEDVFKDEISNFF